MHCFIFLEDEYDIGPVRGDLPESEYAANRAKLKKISQPQSDSQYNLNVTSYSM